MDKAYARTTVRKIAHADTHPHQLELFLKTPTNSDAPFNFKELLAIVCAQQNAVHCIEYLLNRSANADHPEGIEFFTSCLLDALREKYFATAEILFKYGARTNGPIPENHNISMIKYFAINGAWEQTEWLLQHGACPQINLLVEDDNYPGSSKSIYCSLLRRICNGTINVTPMPVNILSLFCTFGADPNNADTIKGDTCLHALIAREGSSSQNKLALIVCLIAAGADVNRANNQGETPLHAATFANEKNIAAYLLLKGANKCAVNKYESTALAITDTLSYNDKSRLEYQDLKNMLQSNLLPDMPAEAIEAEKELQKLKQKIV